MNFRKKVIAAGVKNLAQSYPNVDECNIITDEIYSAFFRESLAQSLGNSPEVDAVLNGLIEEIAAAQKGKA